MQFLEGLSKMFYGLGKALALVLRWFTSEIKQVRPTLMRRLILSENYPIPPLAP